MVETTTTNTHPAPGAWPGDIDFWQFGNPQAFAEAMELARIVAGMVRGTVVVSKGDDQAEASDVVESPY